MNKQQTIGVGALMLAFAVLSACGGGRWIRIQYGEIATDGIAIEEEHGMFRWEEGTLIDSMPSQATELAVSSNVEAAQQAAALADVGAPGIYRVRVSHPRYRQPFYGVLQLRSAHSTWSGPGTRSFQFLVPENRLESATDGRLAVVYEQVSARGGGSPTTWTLWISDRPIPSDDAYGRRNQRRAQQLAARAEGQTLTGHQRAAAGGAGAPGQATAPGAGAGTAPAAGDTPEVTVVDGIPMAEPPQIGLYATAPDPNPGRGRGQRYNVTVDAQLYLQTNIPYDSTSNQITSAMFRGTETTAWLGVCTPVDVVEATDDGVIFTDPSGQRFTMVRYRSPQSASIPRLFERYFGTSCPDVRQLSEVDQQGILNRNVLPGMSKTGVVIAIGYPPQHRTPNLAENVWHVWTNRMAEQQILFADGIVTAVQ